MNGSEPSTDLIGLVKAMQVETRPEAKRSRSAWKWYNIIASMRKDWQRRGPAYLWQDL